MDLGSSRAGREIRPPIPKLSAELFEDRTALLSKFSDRTTCPKAMPTSATMVMQQTRKRRHELMRMVKCIPIFRSAP